MTTSEIQRRLEEIAEAKIRANEYHDCGEYLRPALDLTLDFLRYLTTLEDSEVKEKAKMILEGVS